jgi:hypothetical protein
MKKETPTMPPSMNPMKWKCGKSFPAGSKMEKR